MKPEYTRKDLVNFLERDINYIGTAIIGVLRSMGFGKKRANRFVDEINSRLPHHIQYIVDDTMKKDKWIDRSKRMNKDQFYDLVEALMAVHCDRSCSKNPAKCELRRLLKQKEIPAWDENGKCEYKIDFKKLA